MLKSYTKSKGLYMKQLQIQTYRKRGEIELRYYSFSEAFIINKVQYINPYIACYTLL